jgi:hypothetical protein
MNSNKKSRLSYGLIVTTKKRPHLVRPLKLYNLSKKMILYTSRKNRTSPSILIKLCPICMKPRLIRSQMIIIISNKHLLLSSSSLLQDHRLSMCRRRRQVGKLACEELPKSKSMHVQTYARNPVMIVGAIGKHQTSQHRDRA